MTREEALDIIRFVFLHTDNHLNDDRQISADDIHEALVMACATLCKNSLPSDLDTAAEKYSENILANNEDLQDAIEDAFKAGAEWMAGQGYVDTQAAINEYENWGDGIAKLELGIKEDDGFFEDWQEQNEIILQIRKKQ